MACKYCGKPVKLSPSAEERAAASGQSAAYYRELFPNHSACMVAARSAASVELMRSASSSRSSRVIVR